MRNKQLWRNSLGEGFIYIPIDVVNVLVRKGRLKELARSGKNVYYRYYSPDKGEGGNFVLMYIDRDLYKVINEIISPKTDGVEKPVKLVDILSKNCRFCIGTGGQAICMARKYLCMGNTTISLSRIIWSIKESGFITKLRPDWDIHHKVHKALETISAMSYKSHIDHEGYHSKYGKQSRKKRIEWYTEKEVTDGMKALIKESNEASYRTM